MLGNDDARAHLQERLDVLLKRVDEIGGDLRRPADRDWQERATENENDEVLETLDESSRAEVAQVRAALRRLEAGTYGACATCGAAIGEARMAAMPSATTCVDCARA